jgi:hypothetical protein
MQRYLSATFASAVVLTAALAHGAQPYPSSTPAQTQVYYYKQPAGTPQNPQYYYTQQEPQRPTVFGRLMEMERRKNQAILRFFGLR